jgi:NAD(P)-dependent dehydrogenase (short-subunit alcohol dehydrogenase family)
MMGASSLAITAASGVTSSRRPEEITAATVYPASPLADYVIGATIRVDGGTVRTV